MNDKTAFVIAFLGALIALTPFSEHLKDVPVNFGVCPVKLLILIYISFGLLFLSTYFYALNYARYNLKFLDQFRFLRWLESLGDFFYFLAILSPILYFLFWALLNLIFLVLSYSIAWHKYIFIISNLVSVLLGIVSSVISFYLTQNKSRERLRIDEEQIDLSSAKADKEAKEFLSQNLENASIVESFRLLELSAKKKLISLGVDASRISIIRTFDILLKFDVLKENEYKEIQYIRNLRNEAMYSTFEFSKEEALKVNKIVEALLPKLSVLDNEYFEKKVIEKLIGENGLFLKHHFWLEPSFWGRGFDAKAEGPNFTYLIEIKMTRNNIAILDAFNQLHEKYRKEGIRFLIVVPVDKRIPEYHLESNIAKVLFYDLEKDTLKNRDEIYNWIYKEGD